LKKYLALLAIAVVACFGINTATASAANCTRLQHSPTYWTSYDNKLKFDVTVGNCTTDVDKIGFTSAPNGEYASWQDVTLGYFVSAFNYYDPLIQNVVGAGDKAVITYGRTPYCGGAIHQVYTEGWYQIHNTNNGGSWGPWHAIYSTTVYNIKC
jgi:hypothetical protein